MEICAALRWPPYILSVIVQDGPLTAIPRTVKPKPTNFGGGDIPDVLQTKVPSPQQHRHSQTPKAALGWGTHISRLV